MNSIQVLEQLSAPITATDTGVKATFTIPTNARIVQVGLLIGTDSAAAAVYDVDVRPVFSVTGADVEIAEISKPAADNQGVRFLKDVSIFVLGGAQVLFEATTNTANQAAVAFIRYTQEHETKKA